MRYAFFLVEGPHDVEVIGRILKKFDASRIKDVDDLDPFWESIVPRIYPVNGDLMARVPVPTFFTGPNYSVAVHSVGGENNFVRTFMNIIEHVLLDVEQLSAIALFLDADQKLAQEKCHDKVAEIVNSDIPFFSSLFHEIMEPGYVECDDVKVGVYVFPDNESRGTVEQVLIQCAGVTYGDLLGTARDYVGSVEERFKRSWGQSGEAKVLVGCVANVLRPGKANQVSIQDNKWICEETYHLDSVSRLEAFIVGILGLD